MRRHRAVAPPGVRHRRLQTATLVIALANLLALAWLLPAHAGPRLLHAADVTPSPTTTDSMLVMTVPALQGESLVDAETALVGLGLIPIASPDTSPPSAAIVVNQKPASGDEAEPGDRVVLVWEPGAVVPDLSELSEQDATAKIAAAGLSLTVSGDGGGLVSFQDPAAGKVVSLDSPVTVTLTTEVLQQNSVFVPNVHGLSFSVAEQDLRSQGLRLSPAGESGTPGALATTQNPAAGTQVPQNTPVIVTFAVPAIGGSTGGIDPWVWWLVGGVLIVGVIATAGLLGYRATKRTRQRRWAKEHLHAHAHPLTDSRTRLDPTDGFQPLAVHLSPHSDPGQQTLEETSR